MKKLLVCLIVFINIIFNSSYADTLDDYTLDDFACSYYEEIITQIDSLIEQEMYEEAEVELEKLYNSSCKTLDATKKYIFVLNKLQKVNKAYQIAEANELLDSDIGLLIQAEKNIPIKDYTQARSVYDNILIKTPYDKFAQMGLTHSYISEGSELKALQELKRLPETNDIQYLKAKAYYNLELFEDAYKILKTLPQTDEVLELENEIKRKRAYQFVSGYELYVQKLNEEYKMDANKILFSNSCYEKNLQVYFDYILFIYTSGVLQGQGPEPLNDVTNEIRLGTQGRLNEKIALRADIGVKAFQQYGVMLLTDTWVKYYVNDAFNVKLGFHRNNTEQSFLSAVGVNIDGRFTGQVADNNLYLDMTYRLPKRSYVFTKGGIGAKDGYNMPSDLYWEGMFGIGKLIRYDLTKPYLQKVSLDLVSYQSGYEFNLQNLYDKQGLLYGGFFSPKWYSDNTVNMNFAGKIKNTNFSYGFGAFAGWQFALSPDQSLFIYGASVDGKYRLNDHISFELQYRYYKYANITRNQFLFDLVISLFKKEGQLAKK